ncbi:MAG: hypothetical protein U0525_00715 [Patescibacteria group bacterium]
MRRFFPMAVLSFILLFIFYIIYKIAELTAPPRQEAIFPTPTPAFGLITQFDLSKYPKAPANKEYNLDTVSGIPETATTSAQIAFIPELNVNFGFREKALLLAKELGFDENTQQTKLDDKIFKIVDNTMRLEFEIDTFNYTFTQDITDKNKSVFADIEMPSEDVIKTRGLDLMRTLNRFPDEIGKSTQTVTYFVYKDVPGSVGNVENVKDPTLANMVEVDFFPPKYNGMDSITKNYFTSQNYVVFVPQKGGKDYVLRAQVKVYEASPSNVSMYPLMTGDDAFKVLTSGQAYLISGNIDSVSKVNISRMYTAYLYPDVYTKYLAPVYVFVGDNGFVSYVPAVSPSWVQK